jgi:hypothetical protein
MANVSPLDATKIQARVLIPVIKAFEAELGKERTYSIVGKTINDSVVSLMYSLMKERDIHPADIEFGDIPNVSEIIEHTDKSFAYNVMKCVFADYFRKKGEPEIGYLMMCATDFAIAEALCPSWEFHRTQTIMEGASHCDFRYNLKKK